MFSREKKINLKYSRLALLLEIASWLLVVGILVYVLQVYAGLDGSIPAVFGKNGEVLEMKPKQVVLMQPIIAVFVYIVLTAIGIVFRRAVVPGEEYPVLERVLLSILGIKCVYLLYKLGNCYYVLNSLPAPIWLRILLAVALVFIVAAAVFSGIKQVKTSSVTVE